METSVRIADYLLPKVIEEMKWRKSSVSHRWCYAERTDYNFKVKKMATKCDLGFQIVSLLSYLFDVGTDIWQAIKYFRTGGILNGSLTIAIVAVVHVVINYLAFQWYRKEQREKNLPISIRYQVALLIAGQLTL